LGADNPVTLLNTHHLAVMQERIGNNDAAIQIFSELLPRQKAVMGVYHIQVLSTQYKLGQAYGKIKQFDRALPLIEAAIRDGREHLGLHHEVRLWIRHLALVYLSQGKTEQGIKILEGLNEDLHKTLSANHYDANLISGSLADAYASQSQKQYSKAIPLYLDLIRKDQAKLGFNHHKVFEWMGKLSVCYSKSGDCKQALQYAQEAVRLATERYGPDHLFTIKLRLSVASAMKCDDNNRGIEFFEDLILRGRKTQGIAPEDLFWPMTMLGEKYVQNGQFEKALHVYDDAIAVSRLERAEGGFQSDRVLKIVATEDWLAKVLSDQQQHSAAIDCSAAALRHRGLVDGNSDPQLDLLMRRHARILLRGGDLDSALAVINELPIKTIDDMQLMQDAVALFAWCERWADVRHLSQKSIFAAIEAGIPRMSEQCAILSSFHRELDQEERNEVLELIRNAMAREPESPARRSFDAALGMVEFRNGNDAGTLAALAHIPASPEDDSLSSTLAACFHAMALHRQGKRAEASAVLDIIRVRMRPAIRKGTLPLAPGIGYVDLLVWMVFEEAAMACQMEGETSTPSLDSGK
jgi:tetratricopeptide (TPR) repeat protein